MNGNDRSQFIITLVICFSLVHFCITIYLVFTVYRLAAFIEDVNSHVTSKQKHSPIRHEKRSNVLLEELIKAQGQIILNHCRNSSHSCGNGFNSTDKHCACLYASTISKTGTSHHLTAITKGDILIPCNATGYPVPYVTWKKDGTSMHYDSNHFQTNSGLQISDFRLSDIGNYTCAARNVLGVDTHVITVEIV